MNIEEVREYCLSFEGAEESFPFGDDTLVFKAGGKIFALIPLNKSELSVNLKCEPELAIELREKYSFVRPGYHMNKKHWNTIYNIELIPEKELKEWIKHSYAEVIKKLPKNTKKFIISG